VKLPSSELYQGVILEHNRAPRNFRRMDDATGTADGANPLCGDEVTVFVKVVDDVVQDVSFQGSGCAISHASASLMTQAVKGRSVDDVRRLFKDFHELMTGLSEEPPRDGTGTAGRDAPALGKLVVLGGVRAFPMRVKCATLAWHALNAALKR
jgi:nitrogen fixation protein NifU and related proteins